MKRKALLKAGNEFVVLEESEFEAETELQEALKRNPEVIPVADLDLGEVAVVGKETGVPVGAIDLLLVDADGEVIIVETKLASNPELRRQVVAQVLDYGASLWRTAPTLKEFDRLVLRYWHSDACEDERLKQAGSLREGLEPVFKEIAGEEWDYGGFESTLSDNLAQGRHVLVVVATGLMDRLSKDLLQYLNLCLDLPLYAVEIDVFETEGSQLLVPRGVRYRRKPPPPPPTPRTNRAAFLAACTTLAASFFEKMLDEGEARRMIIYWGSVGFSVRMPLDPPVTVMYGYPPDKFQVYTRDWSLDGQAIAEVRQRLGLKAPFTGSGRYTDTLLVAEDTKDEAETALAFMWGEVEKMMAEARAENEPS